MKEKKNYFWKRFIPVYQRFMDGEQNDILFVICMHCKLHIKTIFLFSFVHVIPPTPTPLKRRGAEKGGNGGG